jgi:hypothetical protein
MKFIIDRKLYDTDKCDLLEEKIFAPFLGYYEMYRSKTKNPFFILVYRLFGRDYYIKTKEEMYQWLYENNKIDLIEKHFGDMIKEGC